MNIRYNFKDESLFKLAMTHVSLANDTKTESNQRLEFLGDSVLSYIIATEIYKMYGKCDEGELTKIRALLVCEKSLAELARELDLGDGIKLGRSEAKTLGAQKDSILADTFEALLGAIYLDRGIECAKEWTLKIFGDRIKGIEISKEENYKSDLQIYFQKRDKGNQVVTYRLKEKTGPDHDPNFLVEAVYLGKIIGEGKGKSRKAAEQQAAKVALDALK
ncbi:MAG: ribonuclease III [Clostridia bacterium]|nr:ribonuclease III [Clostridia bacterium]MBQ9737791.1 ribonuclease III [Clostridia bacterium]